MVHILCNKLSLKYRKNLIYLCIKIRRNFFPQHCNNDDNIENFKNTDIYSNYMFLLIFTSTVTGSPHSTINKSSVGHHDIQRVNSSSLMTHLG